MNRTSIAAMALPLAIALGAPTAQAASQYQKECKPALTKTGQHKVKKIARRMAQQGWTQQVEQLYGTQWARLQNASVSQNGCSLSHPYWNCIYTAKPCRVINTQISPNKPGLLNRTKPNIGIN